MSRLRIALLTEIPAPFRVPLFNALAAHDDVELDVLFLRERDPQRPYELHREEWGFRGRGLPGVDVTVCGRWLVLNAGVSAALRALHPDAVILGGWNQPAFWTALALARRRDWARLGWVESTASDARSDAAPLEWAKRAFLRACDGFLVPGRASVAYLAQLGVAVDRVTIAPNAVDASIFGDRVAAARADRDALRWRLGLDGVVLLAVGRLSPEKGIDVLVRALGRLGAEARVVVAGAGPEQRALEALAERHAPGRVRFLGFVPRDDLPDWYAAADAFVLPSRSEQWGMALNEAAAAGLPLVATEVAGAAQDLIEEGVNGARVPGGDEQALADALERVVADATFRTAAGRRSAELVAPFTAEAWAEAVARVARKAVS